MSVLIVGSSIYTPYRIAFLDGQSGVILWLEALFDLFFLVDIALTFFSAYYNSEDVLIERKSQIAWNYLKFWFILDLASAVPISLILN